MNQENLKRLRETEIIKVTFKCKTNEGIKDITIAAKDFAGALFSLECLYGIKDDGSIIDYRY